MSMKASPSVRANVTDDGLVLLHIDQGKIFSSNTTGARIWQLLEEGLEANDIATKVASETGAPIDRVSADVQTFIDSLKAEAILVDAAAAAS